MKLVEIIMWYPSHLLTPRGEGGMILYCRLLREGPEGIVVTRVCNIVDCIERYSAQYTCFRQWKIT